MGGGGERRVGVGGGGGPREGVGGRGGTRGGGSGVRGSRSGGGRGWEEEGGGRGWEEEGGGRGWEEEGGGRGWEEEGGGRGWEEEGGGRGWEGSGGGERCGSRRGRVNEVRGEARVSEFELAICTCKHICHYHPLPLLPPFPTSLLFPPLFPPLLFPSSDSWILDTGELYSVDGQCYFLFITRHTVVATLVQNREVDSALCGKD